MTAGDQVLENIIKGCKAQASKEIKAELARGRTAFKKIEALEKRITKLQLLERDFTKVVRQVHLDADAALKKDRKLLNKQRAHIRTAARKVARGAACIDRIKKKKMTSFIKDTRDNHWDGWGNKQDADAMRTVRSIAKQGIK